MKLALYGAGGFGRQLVAQHRHLIGIVADDALAGTALCGVPVVHPRDLHPEAETIVAIADPSVRRAVAARLPSQRLGTLIAPSCLVAEEVEIGAGSALCEGTMVVGFCRIGRHFQMNIYSYIGHDCTVGDFVTLSPRVSISGNVTIGDGVFLGTGAIVKQGVTIGDGAFIGMGARVSRDVPAGARVLCDGRRYLAGEVAPLRVAG